MKILLIGGNGQVGTELRRAFTQIHTLVVTTRHGSELDGIPTLACDLSVPGESTARIAETRPDLVINATARTAVDRAESELELAAQINTRAVAEMGAACHALGIPLVHYSADYVFPGDGASPYATDAATAPLGVYGQTKLDGENAIRDSDAQHLILRTAWVYATHGANFLKTMLRVGAERDALRVVAYQVGARTPAWLIADVTAQIVDQGMGKGGTFHLVTQGETSWHGFAEAIFEEAAKRGMLARKPTVEAIPSPEYFTPAKRPAYSVLDTRTLRETYGIELPSWRDALQEILA